MKRLNWYTVKQMYHSILIGGYHVKIENDKWVIWHPDHNVGTWDPVILWENIDGAFKLECD